MTERMRADAYNRFHAPDNVEFDQAAFRSGYESREQSHNHDENPYDRHKGTVGKWLHDSWNAGWADADMGIMSEHYADAITAIEAAARGE